MSAIEVDGRRFAWREVGEGAPLLLVNGYAATGADWDPTFLATLASANRVICPDNRGFGDSELGDGEVSVDGMAADLEALLDALAIERPAVAGWSLGGFVAQRLAERTPSRVASLALIDTDPGGPEAVRAAPAEWARLLDHSGTPREQASRLIGLLFPPGPAAEIDRQLGDVVAAARERLSTEALRAQEQAMDAWHRAERPAPPAERPPTVVVHGAEDVVIPAANAAPLGERWGAERVERIVGCGHAVMAQQPARVAALLAA
ncbi:MAG: alpha/beta fold hydrolase [Solirubrobacterales bacterium]